MSFPAFCWCCCVLLAFAFARCFLLVWDYNFLFCVRNFVVQLLNCFVSMVRCRLLKHIVAGLKALVAVPTTTVDVRSCTSWKKDSPHNREFEKTDLPHDRELQSNDSPQCHQFQSFFELEDDPHQCALCQPACQVSFPDQLKADREPYALEGLPPPPRVAFTG